MQYPPTFSNDLLIYPSSPSTNEVVNYAKRNTDFHMIIPREYFSMTGYECDKIGTSYQAFKKDGCDNELNSCLSNQIYQILGL